MVGIITNLLVGLKTLMIVGILDTLTMIPVERNYHHLQAF